MMPADFKKNGFTLLEILIAIFILGVIFSTIYAAYSSTLTTIRELDEESRTYKMARISIDRILRDLSSLQTYEGDFVLTGDEQAIGNRRFGSLSFWSAAHLAFGEEELSGYPSSIAYFVREDAGGGRYSLWRADRPGARPEPGLAPAGGLIICQDVQFLRFTYYDETGRTSDRWDTSTRMTQQKGTPPAMVQIELGLTNFRDPEKPFRFTTRIFLPVKK
ncbi:MAG: prepilin-type N-terminal cleavage/methylation domain-containing protein [Smithellaceae bacterium]